MAPCSDSSRLPSSRRRSAPTEIGEQVVEEVFLLDAYGVLGEGRGEGGVPRGGGRGPGGERGAEAAFDGGEVGGGVVAPGCGGRQAQDAGGDADAAPVEVAVVGDRMALGGDVGEQGAGGGGEVAFHADQRWAVGPQFVGRGREDGGVLADVDGLSAQAQSGGLSSD